MTEAPAHSFRRMPVGAELSIDGQGTHFRVWTPQRRTVSVVFEGGSKAIELRREAGGYFSGCAPGVRWNQVQVRTGWGGPVPGSCLALSTGRSARLFGSGGSRRVRVVRRRLGWCAAARTSDLRASPGHVH